MQEASSTVEKAVAAEAVSPSTKVPSDKSVQKAPSEQKDEAKIIKDEEADGNESDSDIDISDVDDAVKGEGGSDVEEDWGLWDWSAIKITPRCFQK